MTTMTALTAERPGDASTPSGCHDVPAAAAVGQIASSPLGASGHDVPAAAAVGQVASTPSGASGYDVPAAAAVGQDASTPSGASDRGEPTLSADARSCGKISAARVGAYVAAALDLGEGAVAPPQVPGAEGPTRCDEELYAGGEAAAGAEAWAAARARLLAKHSIDEVQLSLMDDAARRGELTWVTPGTALAREPRLHRRWRAREERAVRASAAACEAATRAQRDALLCVLGEAGDDDLLPLGAVRAASARLRVLTSAFVAVGITVVEREDRARAGVETLREQARRRAAQRLRVELDADRLQRRQGHAAPAALPEGGLAPFEAETSEQATARRATTWCRPSTLPQGVVFKSPEADTGALAVWARSVAVTVGADPGRRAQAPPPEFGRAVPGDLVRSEDLVGVEALAADIERDEAADLHAESEEGRTDFDKADLGPMLAARPGDEARLRALLKKYAAAFEAPRGMRWPPVALPTVGGQMPRYMGSPRRIARPETMAKLKTTLDEWEKLGVVRKLDRLEARRGGHPVVCAPKPGQPGKIRVCIDPSELNKILEEDGYVLPQTTSSIHALRGCRVFGSMDMIWASTSCRSTQTRRPSCSS